MERLLEFVRSNPIQTMAVAGFLIVLALAWAVESSAWRARHR